MSLIIRRSKGLWLMVINTGGRFFFWFIDKASTDYTELLETSLMDTKLFNNDLTDNLLSPNLFIFFSSSVMRIWLAMNFRLTTWTCLLVMIRKVNRKTKFSVIMLLKPFVWFQITKVLHRLVRVLNLWRISRRHTTITWTLANFSRTLEMLKPFQQVCSFNSKNTVTFAKLRIFFSFQIKVASRNFGFVVVVFYHNIKKRREC